MPSTAVLVALSFGAASLGTLGGLGGALFLVPLLLVLGAPVELAAPLGALAVVSGSVAAGPAQLASGLVHHRLGVTVEAAAGSGALVGAIVSTAIAPRVVSVGLAVVALGAAALAFRGAGVRRPPHPLFDFEAPGEWPGTLSGAYRLGPGMVPYEARNVGQGLAGMVGVGVLSGIAGVGGGFLKVPLMREAMAIPVKVAAATSTFTVGITATISLIVFARQGRVEVATAVAVVLGALGGGLVGAKVADRLPPVVTRRVVAALLVVVAVILLVRT
ncbi:MAG: sulfite exporter TauE/SafE family protein [Acidimicrobiia bacterium]|nr:sulfite exporter TauE/SafE family protein [Acidimicrobiia bacterium]